MVEGDESDETASVNLTLGEAHLTFPANDEEKDMYMRWQDDFPVNDCPTSNKEFHVSGKNTSIPGQVNKISVKSQPVKLDTLDHIQIEIEGITVSGIVDSGCQLTVVRQSKIPKNL